ncbi:MAG: hypothetical protein ACKO61_00620 [Actinomycetota bacterium]
MEVIIAVALVFLIGYAVGRNRKRKRINASPSNRTTAARPVRRGYTRECEYGGFGALGATHEASDFGDGGS